MSGCGGIGIRAWFRTMSHYGLRVRVPPSAQICYNKIMPRSEFSTVAGQQINFS